MKSDCAAAASRFLSLFGMICSAGQKIISKKKNSFQNDKKGYIHRLLNFSS
jgi:hypothetical protein